MIIVTPGHQVVLLPCSRVPKPLGIFLHLKFDKDWNNAIDQPIVHKGLKCARISKEDIRL